VQKGGNGVHELLRERCPDQWKRDKKPRGKDCRPFQRGGGKPVFILSDKAIQAEGGGAAILQELGIMRGGVRNEKKR